MAKKTDHKIQINSPPITTLHHSRYNEGSKETKEKEFLILFCSFFIFECFPIVKLPCLISITIFH